MQTLIDLQFRLQEIFDSEGLGQEHYAYDQAFNPETGHAREDADDPAAKLVAQLAEKHWQTSSYTALETLEEELDWIVLDLARLRAMLKILVQAKWEGDIDR